ncbi:nucleoside monophosphate kinase [Candidatus Saccharibacteria bacterium]|nr:nucleoside monophosphate kinase [Candidatus Saccharibacteria bacterium]
MITLFGPTGSGKSEQGKLLAQKYHWTWISAREQLMSLHDKDIQFALDHGMFVDDEAMNGLMERILAKAKNNNKQVVLDGFPSTVRQVQWLIDRKELHNITGAIVLRVPRGELWRRLMLRKRVDDTRAAIERRQDSYDRAMTGMMRVLGQNDVFVREVDGRNEPKDVLERIEEVLADWELIPKKQFAKSPKPGRVTTISATPSGGNRQVQAQVAQDLMLDVLKAVLD